jgi:hypothetical protein
MKGIAPIVMKGIAPIVGQRCGVLHLPNTL